MAHSFQRIPRVPVLLALVSLPLLAGCGGPPDRQNPLAVSSSTRSDFLPEAESLHARYRPVRDDGTPNSSTLDHIPPVLSFEDRTLAENMVGAIELADYRAAVQQAGYWPYLEGENSYTVLAIPNGPFEDYLHAQGRGLMKPERRTHLVQLVRQTILKGRWDIARIRRRAARMKGSVSVPTLAGPGHDVQFTPLADGSVQVTGPDGTTQLRGAGYRQANGTLFIIGAPLSRQ